MKVFKYKESNLVKLKEDEQNIVGLIGLKTIMNGAGPILIKINELINVVNELQEDYNTHLEAHKQNER